MLSLLGGVLNRGGGRDYSSLRNCAFMLRPFELDETGRESSLSMEFLAAGRG